MRLASELVSSGSSIRSIGDSHVSSSSISLLASVILPTEGVKISVCLRSMSISAYLITVDSRFTIILLSLFSSSIEGAFNATHGVPALSSSSSLMLDSRSYSGIDSSVTLTKVSAKSIVFEECVLPRFAAVLTLIMGTLWSLLVLTEFRRREFGVGGSLTLFKSLFTFKNRFSFIGDILCFLLKVEILFTFSENDRPFKVRAGKSLSLSSVLPVFTDSFLES